MAATKRSKMMPAFNMSKEKSDALNKIADSLKKAAEDLAKLAGKSNAKVELTAEQRAEKAAKDAKEAAEKAAKDAEDAKEAADKKAKEEKEHKIADWKARKKYKESILQHYTPGSTQRQGAMEKADHLAGLTAEGIAGEIGINLIIFCLEAFGNTPWWVQTLQFQQSLAKEVESLSTGKPKRICYLPDDNGDYPEIYPADEQGKVDYSASPLDPEQVTPFAIRANGYVPKPSILEGLSIVGDFHSERMSGSSSLRPEQRARMYGSFGNESKKDEKSDLASDATALRSTTSRPGGTRPGG